MPNLPNLTTTIQNRLNSNGYYELTGDCLVDSLVMTNGMNIEGRGHRMYASANFNPTNNPAQPFISFVPSSGDNSTSFISHLQIRNDFNAQAGNGYGIALSLSGQGFFIDSCTIGNPSYILASNPTTGRWFEWDIACSISTASGNVARTTIKDTDVYNYASFGFCSTGTCQTVYLDNCRTQSGSSMINSSLVMPLRNLYFTNKVRIRAGAYNGPAYYSGEMGGEGRLDDVHFGVGHFGSGLLSGNRLIVHNCTFGSYNAPDITAHPQCAGLVIGKPVYSTTNSITGDILGRVGVTKGPKYCMVVGKSGQLGYTTFTTTNGSASTYQGYNLPGGVIRVVDAGAYNNISIMAPNIPPSGSMTPPSSSLSASFPANTTGTTVQSHYIVKNSSAYSNWITEITPYSMTNGNHYIEVLNGAMKNIPIISVSSIATG